MKTLATLCLLFVLSCQPQQSTTLSETEISVVMEATTSYGDAIVSQDLDKIQSLMGADMVLMPYQSNASFGIDAAMEAMQEFPNLEGAIKPAHIEGSGDMAFVRGTYDLTFIINDSTRIPDKGKYIEIWKRQEDGSWKISVDIWNTDIAPEM